MIDDILVKALTQIATGSFAGASTMAVNGEWQEMFNSAQAIAKGALDERSAKREALKQAVKP